MRSRLASRVALLVLVTCLASTLLLVERGSDTRRLETEIAELRRRVEELSSVESEERLQSEYEVVPFSHFTLNRVYPAEPGLGRRVVEKPFGRRRRELLAVISRALELAAGYNAGDLASGSFRIEPSVGAQYRLYFRRPNGSAFRTLILERPFAPLRLVEEKTINPESVHVLVAASGGRLSALRAFVKHLARLKDPRVSLTVSYFGVEGLKEAQLALSRSGLRRLRLLTLNETFSRGRGLQAAVRHWKGDDKEDALLFLCDVDVVFSAKFLDRCRLNTEPGRRVYYPIVFSLYNPTVVYKMQGKPIPPEPERLVISRETGFWRDFGFGMTCQYRSDFLALNGFDEESGIGWGGEDVLLYRKYVRSPLTVVRATDPGLFHLWHEKNCDVPPQQKKACLASKALTEASHAQMGLLAFGLDRRTNHS